MVRVSVFSFNTIDSDTRLSLFKWRLPFSHIDSIYKGRLVMVKSAA